MHLSEVLVVDDYISDDGSGDTYDTEFGIIETTSGIQVIGTRITGAAVGVAATVELFIHHLQMFKHKQKYSWLL